VIPEFSPQKRTGWIDIGKGLSLICVYIAHNEQYTECNMTEVSFFFKPFYLTFFFFVSGYLLYRDPFNTGLKLKSILTKMLYPVIVFSSIMLVPKHVFHKTLNWNVILDVVGGVAFWFVSALIVAQLIFIVIRKISSCSIIQILLCFTLFIIALKLKELFSEHYPWEWKSGMMASLFVSLGYAYRQHESKFEKYIRMLTKKTFSVILIIIYFVVICANYNYWHLSSSIYGVRYDSIPLNLVFNILGIIMMLSVSRVINNNKIIGYIGKNSIVFYFFSGAIPATIATIMNLFLPYHNYFIVLLCTILSMLIAFLVTYSINRYAPFLLNLEYRISGKSK
jgi:fucose 4-O-acetylase-like acetyltransferase